MRLMPTYSFADSFVQLFMQIGHQHLLCGSHSGRCGGLFMGEDSVFSFFFFFLSFLVPGCLWQDTSFCFCIQLKTLAQAHP